MYGSVSSRAYLQLLTESVNHDVRESLVVANISHRKPVLNCLWHIIFQTILITKITIVTGSTSGKSRNKVVANKIGLQ